MEIGDSNQPLKARVRFDSLDERFAFGRNTPILSREHIRWAAHVVPNIPQADIANALFGEWPTEYPHTEVIKHSILAKVAGNIILSKRDVVPAYPETNSIIFSSIVNYFENLKEAR
jgi:hypothetical protein